MKVLYFDCFAGISGDMALGALLDMGVDVSFLCEELAKLQIDDEFELRVSKTMRHGIMGTDLHVCHAASEEEKDHAHAHDHSHAHHPHTQAGQDSAASHVHEHTHIHDCKEQAKGTNKDHFHTPNRRNYTDICRLIGQSTLKETIKERALSIIKRIGEAEAHVHGVGLEDVHFHEVGAVDTIIDVVGTCIAMDCINPDRVYASPLHVGYGTVTCEHGIMPIPAPATAQILKGIPVYSAQVEGELVTPTGAAIIAELADEFRRMDDLMTERIGYGFGKKDYGILNGLRVMFGEQQNEEDSVCVLSANIDDMSGEMLGYAMERLLEAGALDVYYTPIQMKKNRPAYMLSVIGKAEDEDRLSGIILKETTTLGLRKCRMRRSVAQRRETVVRTRYGDIRVKVSARRAVPEYDDCARAAKEHKMPYDRIYEAAIKEFCSKMES
jgi:uncharacterized protein (TIGR00299 family) protein